MAKIAIVGGGAAGLVTAWLLSDQHDVTLFEQNDRLGGHAYTIPVSINNKTVPIDAGFEFFYGHLFPNFLRLLTILNVPLHAYKLSSSFFRKDTHDELCLQLMHNGKISWHTLLPHHLFELIQFGYLVHKGKTLVNNNDTQTTLEQFADSLWLTKSFKNNFFYPLLTAGWGATIENFKHFAAYDILSWAIKSKFSGFSEFEAQEIVGGTITYINALLNTMPHAKIKTSSIITRITKEKKSPYHIIESDGTETHCEHLVIATNGADARKLLTHTSETDDIKEILAHIKYFHTKIALHGDKRFMPEDPSTWSVANVGYNGKRSFFTVYKPWKNPDAQHPIFRTWVTHETVMPKPLYALAEFWHSNIFPIYFEIQKEMEKRQGRNNLWFAGGLYTQGIDSHETVILSAIRIAQQLNPQGKNLKKLTNF